MPADANGLQEQNAKSDGILVFRPATNNPAPNSPAYLVVSRSLGGGANLLDYLLRVLNPKGLPLRDGLFKIKDDKTTMHVFVPDGEMQALNFADDSEFLTRCCWHRNMSIADFVQLMRDIASKGSEGSKDWADKLILDFRDAVEKKKLVTVDLDKLVSLYFVRFQDVLKLYVLEKMAEMFSQDGSTLRNSIFKTIKLRLAKMASKAELKISSEQFESFIAFFQSTDNDGKAEILCNKLQEICSGAQTDSVSKFVVAFLRSCYYLVYEAVTLDFLKRNTRNLFYPGNGITPMIAESLKMEPTVDQEIFWRDLSHNLLSPALIAELEKLLKRLSDDSGSIYTTAGEREEVSELCKRARAILNTYKDAPKVNDRVLIQNLLSQEFMDTKAKDVGDIYKLDVALQNKHKEFKAKAEARKQAEAAAKLEEGRARTPKSPVRRALLDSGMSFYEAAILYRAQADRDRAEAERLRMQLLLKLVADGDVSPEQRATIALYLVAQPRTQDHRPSDLVLAAADLGVFQRANVNGSGGRPRSASATYVNCRSDARNPHDKDEQRTPDGISVVGKYF